MTHAELRALHARARDAVAVHALAGYDAVLVVKGPTKLWEIVRGRRRDEVYVAGDANLEAAYTPYDEWCAVRAAVLRYLDGVPIEARLPVGSRVRLHVSRIPTVVRNRIDPTQIDGLGRVTGYAVVDGQTLAVVESHGRFYVDIDEALRDGTAVRIDEWEP